MKKKAAAVFLFLFVCAFARAHEESDPWKIEHLEEQKSRLSAEYEGKMKELSELTMKIHDIEIQLSELKLKLKDSRTRTPSHLYANGG